MLAVLTYRSSLSSGSTPAPAAALNPVFTKEPRDVKMRVVAAAEGPSSSSSSSLAEQLIPPSVKVEKVKLTSRKMKNCP